MNHQAQTYTLVDGDWVSAPVDVYQAMAQARESDSEMEEAPVEPSEQLPELGILSRTVFASPLFKFVRPANIRHKHLNDVVLVGEDAIQLKEIRDYGHLHHVATKSDFKGRIIAAKVFGDPREVPVSLGSPLPKKQTLHRARRSMTGDEEYVLPPEVIVLTFTNRKLMFLWARHTQAGPVSFIQKVITLPAGPSIFVRFGAFLAIDPKRRAIAVAAQEGRFILYKTKSMERWRKELRQGYATTPIEDERIIQIEGRIMHMDFLSSAAGQDDYHVVLLFIVALQGKAKITCFDWDCREDLSKATVRTKRVLLDMDDQKPSLLIPLSRTSEFLLVFDTHIAAYMNVLSGTPRRIPSPISELILQSLLPGDSKRRPRWVAWDKTPRNREYSKEVFYIAREDGRIMYAERGAFNLETDEAGDWPYRIDTAFACLSVDNSEFSQSYPDVLIAGGASNDGQLCKVGSWPTEYSFAMTYPGTNRFSYVESIANWTPLMDLSVTRLPGIRAPHERDRHSIFVANGANPHGEISEMRYGIQASVEHFFGGINGCTGIWAIDHASGIVTVEGKATGRHYATFAITLPPETIFIRITRFQGSERGEPSGAWEDDAWAVEQLHAGDDANPDGAMRDVETISACTWSSDFAIQITRNEIRSLGRPTLHQIDAIVYDSSLIRVACKAGCPFIAVAFRESRFIQLELVRISHDGKLARGTSQNKSLQLDQDPTCIDLLEVEGSWCVFVGTSNARVTLWVEDDGELILMSEGSLKSAVVDGVHMLLESAVLLSSKDEWIIVCATRSGHLLSSPLPGFRQNSNHFNWHAVKMGTTSAQITASSTDPSIAFVSCGFDFCRVRCSASTPALLDISSIWFTKQMHPGYMQSSVTAMHQLPYIDESHTVGRCLGGLLFTVAGDQLLFSQVDADNHIPHDNSALSHYDCRAVPRKLITGAKPTNLAYLEPTRKMVIATMEAKEEQGPPKGYRVLHSAIKIFDPSGDKPVDEPDIKQENEESQTNKFVAAEHELKHGERVNSIAEWKYQGQTGRAHDLLIVGTSVPGSNGNNTGRRLIINPGKRGSKLQLQKESAFNDPVYFVAVYGNDTSISAIGNTLTYDVFETGLLKTRATITLSSPAAHITIHNQLIYVSTLQHSLFCFRITSCSLDGKVTHDFEQVYQDGTNRSCASHLFLPAPNPTHALVLITDKKTASVTGLHNNLNPTYKTATPTAFEACLSRTVIRLQKGDIRPPWRRSTAPIPGVIDDTIIGACSDGTVYTFSILSEPARHLLRFLQNLISAKQARDPANRDTSLRASALADVLMNGVEGDQDDVVRGISVDPRERERGVGGARHKHVDGDLVGRWIEEDGDIGRLMREGTDGSVRSLWREFVGGVFVEVVDGDGDGEERVREWVGEVFRPVL